MLAGAGPRGASPDPGACFKGASARPGGSFLEKNAGPNWTGAQSFSWAPRRRKRRRLGRSERARLFDPIVARDAAAELQIGVELFRLHRRQRGELPVMEDAAVVEFLHDLRADA